MQEVAGNPPFSIPPWTEGRGGRISENQTNLGRRCARLLKKTSPNLTPVPRHHHGGLTKDRIGDRLELRRSTRPGSLQRKGRTALLEMLAFHLLPCRHTCHR
jgi:hypothetical protein